jgi:hypothetical protein
MTVAKPCFCEIWLATANGKYCVSARLPEEAAVPDDMLCGVPEGERQRVCVSTWYPTIRQAQERAIKLSEHLQRKKIKVLFLFELRLPILGDLHAKG